MGPFDIKTRVDWIGLDWIGLDWIGLNWIGSDWPFTSLGKLKVWGSGRTLRHSDSQAFTAWEIAPGHSDTQAVRHSRNNVQDNQTLRHSDSQELRYSRTYGNWKSGGQAGHSDTQTLRHSEAQIIENIRKMWVGESGRTLRHSDNQTRLVAGKSNRERGPDKLSMPECLTVLAQILSVWVSECPV